jgi:hypothetical protein
LKTSGLVTVLFKHPTQGAHPDKSEWFHCTRIHTITLEWLVIFEVFPDTKPSIFWV